MWDPHFGLRTSQAQLHLTTFAGTSCGKGLQRMSRKLLGAAAVMAAARFARIGLRHRHRRVGGPTAGCGCRVRRGIGCCGSG